MESTDGFITVGSKKLKSKMTFYEVISKFQGILLKKGEIKFKKCENELDINAFNKKSETKFNDIEEFKTFFNILICYTKLMGHIEYLKKSQCNLPDSLIDELHTPSIEKYKEIINDLSTKYSIKIIHNDTIDQDKIDEYLSEINKNEDIFSIILKNLPKEFEWFTDDFLKKNDIKSSKTKEILNCGTFIKILSSEKSLNAINIKTDENHISISIGKKEDGTPNIIEIKKPYVRKPFVRKPCMFFTQGNCRYGDNCKFLHNNIVETTSEPASEPTSEPASEPTCEPEGEDLPSSDSDSD